MAPHILSTLFMGHPKGAHVGDGTAEHATKAQGTGCTRCTACSPRKLCNRQFAPLSAPLPTSQPAQNSQPAQPIASRLNPKTIYGTPAHCPLPTHHRRRRSQSQYCCKPACSSWILAWNSAIFSSPMKRARRLGGKLTRANSDSTSSRSLAPCCANLL